MRLMSPVLTVALLVSTANFALAAATGAEIKAAVSDNTVQGNMDATGAYAEFYAADGTIKGKDYTGKWTIEGDSMCFAYVDSPKDCYAVEISGDQVRWLKDGKSTGTGTGTVVKGNVNGF